MEAGVGILVDLKDPEFEEGKSTTPKTPKNLEEQMRKMELNLEKRRSCQKARKPEPELLHSPDEISMIQDEEFDFDFDGLSPLRGSSDSSQHQDGEEEDEDEIFIGKVGLKEKCVAKVVEQEEAELKVLEEAPLSAQEMAEIFLEAQKVASIINVETDRQERIKVATPVMSTPTVQLFKERQGVQTRSGGRKRKGTFTLEDEEEEQQPSAKSRPGHQRKGTFTLSSSDEDTPVKPSMGGKSKMAAKTLLLPGVAKQSTGAGHQRKGTFDMDSGVESLPVKKSMKTEQPEKENAGPPANGSRLMQNPPQRRSLRAPATFGLKKPAGQESRPAAGPLKALANPSSLKAPETQQRERRISGGPKAAASKLKLPTDQQPTESKQTGKRLSSGLPTAVIQPEKRQVTSGLQAPKARSSLGSGLQAPRQGLKPPSTRGSLDSDTTTTSTAKPSLMKGPLTKLQLMQPGQLQMRGGLKQPAAGQRGPLKATERPTGLKPTAPRTGRMPLASTVNGVQEQRPVVVKRAVSPVRRSQQTTPIKQEKNVQPKRLIDGLKTMQTPPRKSSDSSNASGTPQSNRRSFLPTPGRTFTGPRRSSSSVSSASSMDSTASPKLRGRSPATRRSLASPSTRYGSSPMKTRPKIQHTPQNKENTQEPQRSIWSPIRRQKPTDGEEAFQCTKRTAIKYQ